MEQIKLVKEEDFQRAIRRCKELHEVVEANKENAAKKKIGDYFGSMKGKFGDPKDVVQSIRDRRNEWR